MFLIKKETKNQDLLIKPYAKSKIITNNNYDTKAFLIKKKIRNQDLLIKLRIKSKIII